MMIAGHSLVRESAGMSQRMNPLAFLEARLGELRSADLFRNPGTGAEREELEKQAARRGRRLLDVSSNDYLGYGSRGVSRETLDACAGLFLGAGASRLLGGTRRAHDNLEATLADWVHFPAALLFSSGYAANVGTVAALFGPGDLLVSDALNHASLIDGCRLARARVAVVPHFDLGAVEDVLRRAPERNRAVLTESYFSMDADTPDLVALRALCDHHGAALLVDEAHALGAFGPAGDGLCADRSVRPDLLVGTLGKAVASQGAFIATDPSTRTWLWNRARSFVFSTGVSPLLSVLTAARVAQIRADDSTRARLRDAATFVRSALADHGVAALPTSHGPVIPIILGSTARALAAARRLRDEDILAFPIRPPTVPEGTSRLRVTVTADLSSGDLTRLTAALVVACA
jgi:8-amino-7-oxononanoate synthase